jgi:GNAT superfamily N-acetyltransferase
MLHIRDATVDDVGLILGFIRELAEFEREPDAVTATEDDLRRFGFGPERKFRCVIAEWDGAPVGFALFFNNFSTWNGKPGLYLEDLYVRPSERGKGIGKALLKHLARIAVSEGNPRYVWQVLDWNENAIRFYEGLGARPLKEWITMRVEGEALRTLAEEP